MKTSELEGDALDYAVQCAEHGTKPLCSVAEWASDNDYGYSPSKYWDRGGPIIANARIQVAPVLAVEDGRWCSNINFDPASYGKTPLIAAMRAYVASKLGPDVEFP